MGMSDTARLVRKAPASRVEHGLLLRIELLDVRHRTDSVVPADYPVVTGRHEACGGPSARLRKAHQE